MNILWETFVESDAYRKEFFFHHPLTVRIKKESESENMEWTADKHVTRLPSRDKGRNILTHRSKSSGKFLVDAFRHYREKLKMTNSLYSCPNVIHLYPMGKWARTYEISIPPRSRVKLCTVLSRFSFVYFFFAISSFVSSLSLFFV